MHMSGDVFLDADDDVKVGGTGEPWMWVRVGSPDALVLFGQDPLVMERVGEALFAAARDLRAAQENRPALDLDGRSAA